MPRDTATLVVTSSAPKPQPQNTGSVFKKQAMLGPSSLTVAGYKSIRELRDFKLRNLNVLIGANGAGKSNFMGLFQLLNAMYEQRLQLYVQIQGGPDALLHFGRGTSKRIRVEFRFPKNDYKFELVPSVDNRLIFANEEMLAHERHQRVFASDGGQQEALFNKNYPKGSRLRGEASVLSWRKYHFQDTSDTAKVKQRHATNDNLVFKTDGANLAAYLRMLRKEHEAGYWRIVRTIQLVAPYFDDFVHRDGDLETIELEWAQKGNTATPFKAHMLSDGTLRFICLATLLLQPAKLLPATVLIDEPELGLHPYAIGVLADVFKQVSESRQLIVSTQSVELINNLLPEDVIVVDQEDGASTFRRFETEELADWMAQYGLGELWNRNVLGGRP